MSARAPGDSLATELRDLNVTLEEQWKRRYRCPSCGKPCRPDLERDPFTRAWITKLQCRSCGFRGQGELAQAGPEVRP